MTKFWFAEPASLAITADNVDLVPDGFVECTEIDYSAHAAAILDAAPAAPQPVITALHGNGARYITDPNTRRVTLTIVAPVGGNRQGRPTINDISVSASPGGAPYIFDYPGTLVVETKAGNNDLLIVEEF